MHIAIVGAGLAGLTCARHLAERGHRVVIYERNAEAGGRMGTRQTELGGFDHGAQYFTASSDTFRKEVAAWRKAGWVAPWAGRLVSLDQGRASAAGRSGAQQRMVAVPGMGALGQHLAQGLSIRFEQTVRRLERFGGQWLLAVQAETVAIDASAGPFDAVILALPADLAQPLLQPVSPLAGEVGQEHLAPCWALILGFQDELGLPYDGAWVQGSRLKWIARDASKPERRPGEHWIAHASPEWSTEHLADDPERVKEKLLKAFHQATGSQVRPVYADVHRWRYAQATSTLPGECLWDAQARLGVCGDWFAAGLDGSGRVENAFLSGLALARAAA
ncbi:MAG TPA: FAD-dependent oxidoreductase [Noviherbaspirillum sp.]|uniref:NAD(P)/FAD-dependent oxidoreductase n=1 Tax=Noviherbaspirillum sp. TaxID=1926288 RepID=UPI002D4AA99A|nr:FAD-dependent oxidoreductase [Noviherbaspirillum sp.]HYD94639.1 FAD-dependent oxidoreductase [Noviherbaspirillum sp.]